MANLVWSQDRIQFLLEPLMMFLLQDRQPALLILVFSVPSDFKQDLVGYWGWGFIVVYMVPSIGLNDLPFGGSWRQW